MNDVEALEIEPSADEELAVESTGEELTESTESEATEEVADETDLTDEDGQPRDDDGRFAQKEPQAEGQAAVTAAPIAPDSPQANAAAGKPFVFRADREEYTIDGAQIVPGVGLTVPESQLQRTQQLLSQGVYLEKNWRRQEAEWQTRIEAAENKAAPKELVERETRANALLAELTQVLTNPDVAQEFIANLEIQGPILMERAQRRMIEQRLAEYEGKNQQQQTQDQQQQEQTDKVDAFRETVEALKSDPRFKAFSQDDWQDYEEEMASLESVLFVRKEDGLYLDQARMTNAAIRTAKYLGKAQQIAQKQVSSLKTAVNFNAARTGTPRVAIPEAAPAEQKAKATPQSYDEWRTSVGLS